jgi:hypothetical protein
MYFFCMSCIFLCRKNSNSKDYPQCRLPATYQNDIGNIGPIDKCFKKPIELKYTRGPFAIIRKREDTE